MNTLDRLAKHCGITDSMVDAFGRTKQTDPGVKRAILQAMGYQADTEEAAQSSLDDLVRREWSRALPPVLVAYVTGGEIPIPVNLPGSTREIHWTVTFEDGTRRVGSSAFGAMPKLADGPTAAGIQARELALPADLPCGYHSLTIDCAGVDMVLIVTSGKCWLPSLAEASRFWGIEAKLFLVRSDHNWGIGDFSDLRELMEFAHTYGANAVGVNPLHAMFPDRPEDASPYSPSDRTLLNVLSIDVQEIPELANCASAKKMFSSEEFSDRLRSAREAVEVQYKVVAELKLPLLELLFSTFEEESDPERVRQFDAFRVERQALLDGACLFQALRAHFSRQSPSLSDCHDWPPEYRTFDSPAVRAFAEENAKLIRFHLWMQWIADEQLKAATESAREMAIGLYRDLAVGASASGAEVWRNPDALVSGASVGAPPDILNVSGQNWGLPPLHPILSREHAYTSFIELVRSNMRYAGGLRIDHVMALRRLYWIPKGNDSKDGAYVQYPLEDLVGILALESQRNRCLVVGEDLGTVPEGFRERMAEANILSYRMLFFEKDIDAFVPAADYPRLAVSVASNHDLPTLRGWYKGNEIDLKERLKLYPSGPEEVRKERERDRLQLRRLLREHDLITEEADLDPEGFTEAVHLLLARTCSLLTLVQLDDLVGEEQQVNVPGTTDEYPNWRRRLSIPLKELASMRSWQDLAHRLTKERSRA